MSNKNKDKTRWFLTANRQPRRHLACVYFMHEDEEVEGWWSANGRFLRRTDGAILESDRWRYRDGWR